MIQVINKISLFIIIIIIVSGCNETVYKQETKETNIGFYQKTEGLKYRCGEKTGYTKEHGKFTYEINSSCSFYINDIFLESIDTRKVKKKFFY